MQSTRTRFELARALPIHLAGEHLNHSVTASSVLKAVCQFIFPICIGVD